LKEQREELCRLAPASDRAAESDELFFKRFPHRRHRIRRAHRAELEQHAIANNKPKLDPLPKGSDWALGWDTPSLKGSTAGSFSRNAVGHVGDVLLFEIETTPASAELKERSSPWTSRTAVVQERARDDRAVS
jgi:hypothetical protein